MNMGPALSPNRIRENLSERVKDGSFLLLLAAALIIVATVA